MDLTFLGGARTVTGSRHLVDTGRARVLIDCGMFQGGPAEAVRNRVPLGVDPKTLDAVILTHAHLDHCGLLPLLVREGFRGAIVCTAATAALARLVLLDSAKLQEEFAKRSARRDRHDPGRAAADEAHEQKLYDAAVELAAEGAAEPGGPDPEDMLRASPAEVVLDLDAPLYTVDDANDVLPMLRPVPYGAEREVAQGVHATLLDAGHILGSAMVRLRLARPGGGRDTIVVFSGDLGRPNTPILRDPTPMTEADVVVCESTYGGREHEAAEASIATLASVVSDVAARKGVLLIPSFAIGRTQEVVWELHRLADAGRVPQLPLFLDSPMAKAASDIYRAHPESYDQETAALLAANEAPLDYPGQRIVQTPQESERIAAPGRPVGDHPVRGLPGRGVARRPPGPRGEDGADRRPRDGRPRHDPVPRRVLRPQRRAGAAGMARWLHPRAQAGRPRGAVACVPRPRGPAGAAGAGTQGGGARAGGGRAVLGADGVAGLNGSIRSGSPRHGPARMTAYKRGPSFGCGCRPRPRPRGPRWGLDDRSTEVVRCARW
jgi:metallo-beta-lactamase family protein